MNAMVIDIKAARARCRASKHSQAFSVSDWPRTISEIVGAVFLFGAALGLLWLELFW